MADAKQCDRCKEFYSLDRKYKPRFFRFSTNEALNSMIIVSVYNNKFRVDLCDKCMKSLDTWYYNGFPENQVYLKD